MKQYVRFYETHGDGVFFKAIDINSISEYDSFLLQSEIIGTLEKVGVSSFSNGLFWTINPNDYVEWINNLLPFEDRCIPFVRSAFGDFLFIREGNIMVLNSSQAFVSLMTDDIESFFNRYLTDNWFFNTFFNNDLFEKIKDKTLEEDECFGFCPLLSLGGERSIESLERVKIHEHLDILLKSSKSVDFYEH